MPVHPVHPVASNRLPVAEAHRVTRLARRAAQLLRVLHVLRRARDDETITTEQYEAAIGAIERDPECPRDP